MGEVRGSERVIVSLHKNYEQLSRTGTQYLNSENLKSSIEQASESAEVFFKITFVNYYVIIIIKFI